jgi:flagellin-specific chaperone FliS
MDVAGDILQTKADYRAGNVADAYRTQQVLSTSPERLVLMAYDYVLAGCNVQDKTKASRGLAELIDALDFSQGDIAVGLLRLYQYAMDRVREGDFDGAVSIIRPLREAWGTALRETVSTPQAAG